ncbi:hypothetical protein CARUB_v10025615mg [Capsella rubella]|uniref:F-box domain-containing protein n=1 Tax=Capsella rubella TaxID=81985 RepID=R0HZ30_9BRAS|nr:hypothetical protein CARUB_v10025615mg [Capsella rubella]
MTSSRARVRKKRNKVLEDQTTISDLLPTDLLMDILKLLPAKTLVRFLCVSKLWSSIIRRKDFKKLFLTESSNRPHRLFFISPQDEDKDKDCVLFSLETDDSGEALIAAYHKTHLPYPYTYDAAHVRDMICFRADFTYEDLVVYNNSTRRSITLPKLDSQSFVVTHFLSYDPIDDVYKVLCMTRLKNTTEWKLVFEHTYRPTNYGICINGVLYYLVYGDKKTMHRIFVVSFDVRSENFDLINIPDEVSAHLLSSTIMIRYEGKLAFMYTYIHSEGTLVLWVLEDAMKHEWLKKIFEFCNLLPLHLHNQYRFVDFNDAGEFVLAVLYWCEPPYYVYYYDPKRNSLRKVPITGLRWPFPTYLFTSQVESLMFL